MDHHDNQTICSHINQQTISYAFTNLNQAHASGNCIDIKTDHILVYPVQSNVLITIMGECKNKPYHKTIEGHPRTEYRFFEPTFAPKTHSIKRQAQQGLSHIKIAMPFQSQPRTNYPPPNNTMRCWNRRGARFIKPNKNVIWNNTNKNHIGVYVNAPFRISISRLMMA